MSAAVAAPPAPSSAHDAPDDVFWTELEVRRLGNLVSETVQSGRYIGSSRAAASERSLMRARLTAMRRKSLRVLHRAEIHTGGTWPGLDDSITRPVDLAEEYVRLVREFQEVLEEEVERAGEGEGEEDVGDIETVAEDAVEEDAVEDISYREALALEEAAGGRGELLEGDLRQRKGGARQSANAAKTGTGKYSAEDEALMARHQPVQDELTNDLVDLVGRLKGNLTEINTKIRKDGQVIDEADAALDGNLAGIRKTRQNLGDFTRATTISWWTIWVALAAVLVTFILVFLLTKVPI